MFDIYTITGNLKYICLPNRNKTYQHLTDAELLERFYTTRDNKWLGILLPRYTVLLLGVSMKYLRHEEDARDAVQQIFLKVIAELPKYKVEYFKSWVYMIARNHCLMRLRNLKSSREMNHPFDEETGSAQEPHDTTETLEKEARMLSLEENLRKLSKEQYECIHLFYMKKNTYDEIAQKTGYSLSQVKSYLQNGKRKLKLFMEQTTQEQK